MPLNIYMQAQRFFSMQLALCAQSLLPFYTMDRRELDAIVSFLVLNHVIPSLPVVCGRGEGSGYAEAVASSHDLLAEGIRFQLLHPRNFTAAALEASRDAKQEVLLALHATIAAEVGPGAGAITDAQVDACYALFCAAARAYHAQYAGCPDLRVCGIDSVCRSDLAHTQTLAHLRARDSMFEPGEEAEPLAVGALSSYRELIRAAVRQLATVSAAA